MWSKISIFSCRFQEVCLVQCQKWQVPGSNQHPNSSGAVKRQRRKTLHVWANGSQFIYFWRRQINCSARLWTKLSSSTWHLQILVAPKNPKQSKTSQNNNLVTEKFSLQIILCYNYIKNCQKKIYHAIVYLVTLPTYKKSFIYQFW